MEIQVVRDAADNVNDGVDKVNSVKTNSPIKMRPEISPITSDASDMPEPTPDDASPTIRLVNGFEFRREALIQEGKLLDFEVPVILELERMAQDNERKSQRAGVLTLALEDVLAQSWIVPLTTDKKSEAVSITLKVAKDCIDEKNVTKGCASGETIHLRGVRVVAERPRPDYMHIMANTTRYSKRRVFGLDEVYLRTHDPVKFINNGIYYQSYLRDIQKTEPNEVIVVDEVKSKSGGVDKVKSTKVIKNEKRDEAYDGKKSSKEDFIFTDEKHALAVCQAIIDYTEVLNTVHTVKSVGRIVEALDGVVDVVDEHSDLAKLLILARPEVTDDVVIEDDSNKVPSAATELELAVLAPPTRTHPTHELSEADFIPYDIEEMPKSIAMLSQIDYRGNLNSVVGPEHHIDFSLHKAYIDQQTERTRESRMQHAYAIKFGADKYNAAMAKIRNTYKSIESVMGRNERDIVDIYLQMEDKYLELLSAGVEKPEWWTFVQKIRSDDLNERKRALKKILDWAAKGTSQGWLVTSDGYPLICSHTVVEINSQVKGLTTEQIHSKLMAFADTTSTVGTDYHYCKYCGEVITYVERESTGIIFDAGHIVNNGVANEELVEFIKSTSIPIIEELVEFPPHVSPKASAALVRALIDRLLPFVDEIDQRIRNKRSMTPEYKHDTLHLVIIVYSYCFIFRMYINNPGIIKLNMQRLSANYVPENDVTEIVPDASSAEVTDAPEDGDTEIVADIPDAGVDEVNTANSPNKAEAEAIVNAELGESGIGNTDTVTGSAEKKHRIEDIMKLAAAHISFTYVKLITDSKRTPDFVEKSLEKAYDHISEATQGIKYHEPSVMDMTDLCSIDPLWYLSQRLLGDNAGAEIMKNYYKGDVTYAALIAKLSDSKVWRDAKYEKTEFDELAGVDAGIELSAEMRQQIQTNINAMQLNRNMLLRNNGYIVSRDIGANDYRMPFNPLGNEGDRWLSIDYGIKPELHKHKFVDGIGNVEKCEICGVKMGQLEKAGVIEDALNKAETAVSIVNYYFAICPEADNVRGANSNSGKHEFVKVKDDTHCKRCDYCPVYGSNNKRFVEKYTAKFNATRNQIKTTMAEPIQRVIPEPMKTAGSESSTLEQFVDRFVIKTSKFTKLKQNHYKNVIYNLGLMERYVWDDVLSGEVTPYADKMKESEDLVKEVDENTNTTDRGKYNEAIHKLSASFHMARITRCEAIRRNYIMAYYKLKNSDRLGVVNSDIEDMSKKMSLSDAKKLPDLDVAIGDNFPESRPDVKSEQTLKLLLSTISDGYDTIHKVNPQLADLFTGIQIGHIIDGEKIAAKPTEQKEVAIASMASAVIREEVVDNSQSREFDDVKGGKTMYGYDHMDYDGHNEDVNT